MIYCLFCIPILLFKSMWINWLQVVVILIFWRPKSWIFRKKLFLTSLFISSFYVDVKFSINLLYWIMLTFPYEIFIPQSWNILFYFCFFPENVPLIFYCIILWKKAMKHYYLYIFRGHRRRRIKCANNIFILFDIFMSHLPFPHACLESK